MWGYRGEIPCFISLVVDALTNTSTLVLLNIFIIIEESGLHIAYCFFISHFLSIISDVSHVPLKFLSLYFTFCSCVSDGDVFRSSLLRQACRTLKCRRSFAQRNNSKPMETRNWQLFFPVNSWLSDESLCIPYALFTKDQFHLELIRQCTLAVDFSSLLMLPGTTSPVKFTFTENLGWGTVLMMVFGEDKLSLKDYLQPKLV